MSVAVAERARDLGGASCPARTASASPGASAGCTPTSRRPRALVDDGHLDQAGLGPGPRRRAGRRARAAPRRPAGRGRPGSRGRPRGRPRRRPRASTAAAARSASGSRPPVVASEPVAARGRAQLTGERGDGRLGGARARSARRPPRSGRATRGGWSRPRPWRDCGEPPCARAGRGSATRRRARSRRRARRRRGRCRETRAERSGRGERAQLGGRRPAVGPRVEVRRAEHVAEELLEEEAPPRWSSRRRRARPRRPPPSASWARSPRSARAPTSTRARAPPSRTSGVVTRSVAWIAS